MLADPCDSAGKVALEGAISGGIGGALGGGGAVASGWGGKAAMHGAHHTFGDLGKLPHAQLNLWQKGVRGSGKVFRVPWPWGK